MDIIAELAKELGVNAWQVENTVKLIDEGNTIPFIARYRKELTGELDDTQLRDLGERLEYMRNLEARKEEVLRLIGEQGKLTDALSAEIQRAVKLQEVEDLYRPYRQKKRTRATIAKEKGLEPLADILKAQKLGDKPLLELAEAFINPEKKVLTGGDAVKGAQDILAERISDCADYRKQIRAVTYRDGVIFTKGSTDENNEYTMYYDFHEAVNKIVPHRVLAINRGEKDEKLAVKLEAPVDTIIKYLNNKEIFPNSPYRAELEETIKDAYVRLIAPSIEREIRNELTEKAEEQAIKVFASNLRNLLMQAPVKDKVVMGFDPGYRTGCKIAVVDETGKLLDTATVYATLGDKKVEESKNILKDLIQKHHVNLISLGNGTASRESEKICAEINKEIPEELHYIIVSEAGASVYSASELAAKEYPDVNVSLRGAISIARRLQDPLAELVKIDPKAVGVGQYQHDVSQKKLTQALDGVVENCVNSVGVDLNTASPELLQHIAGINTAVAKNIVAYREENGKFENRKQLLKVKKLGEKAYLQCAGFLRIPEAENILDNTGVHPESYAPASKLMERFHNNLDELRLNINRISIGEVADEIGVGVPTLKDIIDELKKPGRDVRDEMPKPIFHTDVMELKDLKEGMVLTGTVRNVTDFGAFVDIGVHQDGLVHISQLSDQYVKKPLDVVKLGDVVTVKVLGVDTQRQRISLTMKHLNAEK